MSWHAEERKNAAWTNAARELYDGYNSGKAVTRKQVLPQYFETVRRASGGGIEYMRPARQALRNIERLAQNGAPAKTLKAAYQELIDAAAAGSEKELEKACRTAIEEKSRYVADRIIRTEVARAWADGFWANAFADDDVVAVKWKLSSRHPVFDLCDMYAKADMYGLGAGVFPKDKVPPLPVHPHCLCRVTEVYKGEVDLSRQKDRVREAGCHWLDKLTPSQRRRVLGIDGEKRYKAGEDWRSYARGWTEPAERTSRLKGNVIKSRSSKKKIEITQKTIDNLGLFQYPSFSSQQNKRMLELQQKLLTIAMKQNGSNEVAMIISARLNNKVTLIGDENLVLLDTLKARAVLAAGKGLHIIHNHPYGASFSLDDIHTLTDTDSVKNISLITNDGCIETLQKSANCDKVTMVEVTANLQKQHKQKKLGYREYIELLLAELVKRGALVWKS